MANVLHLNLHREFFAAIATGRKHIEYRRQSPYWRKASRLTQKGTPWRMVGAHRRVCRVGQARAFAEALPDRYPRTNFTIRLWRKNPTMKIEARFC